MIGFVRGKVGCSLGDEPMTLKRCHSCGLSWLYEALQLKGGSLSVDNPTNYSFVDLLSLISCRE